MGLWNLLQYALFLLVVAVLVKPVGGYVARVFNREKTALDFVLRPVERLIYKLARVHPEQEMDWKTLASLFARQRRRPATLGTLPTDTFSFGVLLVGTALIVGALSYFAALALGPIVEHFMMRA
jgi:K+-transporting ATPase A subunit